MLLSGVRNELELPRRLLAVHLVNEGEALAKREVGPVDAVGRVAVIRVGEVPEDGADIGVAVLL